MIPSTTKAAKAASTEPVKPQARNNFVLSLLTACSSSVPATGKEGEAKLSEQLSSLLEEKAMSLDELDLLYRYRFGFGISDALKLVGFDGKILDFLDQQKCFSVHEGLVSVMPAATTNKECAGGKVEEAHVPEVPKDFGKGQDNVPEAASDAETESTADAESHLDSDSDIDVPGWHSVGNRLVAALGSAESLICSEAEVEAVPWKELSGRLAAAIRSDDEDEEPWKTLSGRVAASLMVNDDDEFANADAWHDVGSRFAVACKRSIDNEDCEDLNVDADEWRSVGARVLRSLDNLDGEIDNL